jgi:phosphoribosylformylglycinamidine synthase subunit PurS
MASALRGPLPHWSTRVGRIVVDVMLKPEILDPQGQAVAGALPRLGFEGFTSVRQGKRFELEVAGEVTAEVLTLARDAAAVLLSNPVIEDVVRVAEAGPGTDLPGRPAGAGADLPGRPADDHPVP